MPTLAAYRHALAVLLGGYERGTASASGTTNTTQQLECLTGSHTGLRFRSTVNAPGLLEDKWLFRPDSVAAGDRDRLVATYAPTTGLLTPDDAWTNAPTSEAFEVLPIFSGAETTTVVNEALKRCRVVVEFSFVVASAQTRRHSLAVAAPWLTDDRDVYRVAHINTGLDPLVHDRFGAERHGRAVTIGGTVYLEDVTFATTDTVYVEAVRTADGYCRASAGVFGDLTTGLSAETDEAVPDAEWVAWAAISGPARDRIDAAIEQGSVSEQQAAQLERGKAAARFTDLTRKHFRPPERTFAPLTWLGPTRAASW